MIWNVVVKNKVMSRAPVGIFFFVRHDIYKGIFLATETAQLITCELNYGIHTCEFYWTRELNDTLELA